MSGFSVPQKFVRNAQNVQDLAPLADTGLWLINYMCRRIGVPSLDGLDVLDFGCGSRFADAIVNRGVPLRSYVGIEVDKEMVDYLNANVGVPRLTFHHFDALNPLYNPGGRPMTGDTVLPIGDQQFDVLCMFSVITHQLPHDAREIFRMLRRHARPSAHLFFSVYLDTSAEQDVGEAGYGEHRPRKPTALSIYSLKLVTKLLQETKWRIVSVEPANHEDMPILDSLVCAPA